MSGTCTEWSLPLLPGCVWPTAGAQQQQLLASPRQEWPKRLWHGLRGSRAGGFVVGAAAIRVAAAAAGNAAVVRYLSSCGPGAARGSGCKCGHGGFRVWDGLGAFAGVGFALSEAALGCAVRGGHAPAARLLLNQLWASASVTVSGSTAAAAAAAVSASAQAAACHMQWWWRLTCCWQRRRLAK